jgi:hypothetical protein
LRGVWGLPFEERALLPLAFTYIHAEAERVTKLAHAVWPSLKQRPVLRVDRYITRGCQESCTYTQIEMEWPVSFDRAMANFPLSAALCSRCLRCPLFLS